MGSSLAARDFAGAFVWGPRQQLRAAARLTGRFGMAKAETGPGNAGGNTMPLFGKQTTMNLVPDETLCRCLQRCGQQHLLDHLEQLDSAARQKLLQELGQVDWELIQRLYQQRHRQQEDWASLAAEALPPQAVRYGEPWQGQVAEAVADRGREALAQGQVAVLIVAGGEGTRLGFPHPKGMFPVGPVSGASLYQILLEKVLARSQQAARAVPLLLMTSPSTDAPTRRFLEEHRWFGLDPEQVFLFTQGTMPAVDAATGQVLLREPDRLCSSPDGHGGMLAALVRSGGLQWLRQQGVKHLFYLQVDNPLAPVADPLVLGYHLLAASEMTTLVVRKPEPRAPLGNVVQIGGRVHVIEYSDLNVLDDALVLRTTEEGEPVFWAGNLAIHVIDVDFLERVSHLAEALPWHLAHKRVGYWDPRRRCPCQPERPNALKFERFIFDLLPQAQGAIVVEVEAAEFFAPVKNAPGAEKDTPELAQAAMVRLFRRWLEQAGVQVAPGVQVEISPCYAVDAQALVARDDLPRQITADCYLSR